MDRLEHNKQNVMAFYDLMFNQNQPRKAIELYAGDTYTQHNPQVADGRDAFIAYFDLSLSSLFAVLFVLYFEKAGRTITHGHPLSRHHGNPGS